MPPLPCDHVHAACAPCASRVALLCSPQIDFLIESYDVFKVETIGECVYVFCMCLGGRDGREGRERSGGREGNPPSSKQQEAVFTTTTRNFHHPWAHCPTPAMHACR